MLRPGLREMMEGVELWAEMKGLLRAEMRNNRPGRTWTGVRSLGSVPG